MKFRIKSLSILMAMILLVAVGCSKKEKEDLVSQETITRINFEESTVDISLGGTKTLVVKHSPANLSAPSYTWSSSDPTVATVTNGEVKALKLSQTTIKTEALGLKAEIIVKIVAVAAQSISLTTSLNTLVLGEKTNINFEILPANTTDKSLLEIEWAFSDSNIATVINGEVTAIGFGTVDITAKVKNTTISGKISITVKAVSVASVSLQDAPQSFHVGTEATLQANVLPANASNKVVTWSSSNSNIVSVNAAGLIKGIAVGSAIITATSQDGNKTATVTISVSSIAVSSVSFSTISFNNRW
jgi:uncharacterized protein YjdB